MGGSCAAVSAFTAALYVLILCLLPVLFVGLVVLLLVCPFVLVASLGCVGFVFASLCLFGLRYPQNAIFPAVSEDFILFSAKTLVFEILSAVPFLSPSPWLPFSYFFGGYWSYCCSSSSSSFSCLSSSSSSSASYFSCSFSSFFLLLLILLLLLLILLLLSPFLLSSALFFFFFGNPF